MHHRHGDFGRRLSEAERLEIRRLVRAGEPYRVAAAALGTTPKTIGLLMRTTGGLPPRAVTRSPLRLSAAEREEISRELRLPSCSTRVTGASAVKTNVLRRRPWTRSDGCHKRR